MAVSYLYNANPQQLEQQMNARGGNITASDTSYSGTDILAYVKVTDPRTNMTKMKLLGNIATLSYSIHREKFPVRTLGTTYPKKFVRGPRTIAGTMVFNVFDRYALYDVMDVKAALDTGMNENTHALLGDQMAPFDLTLYFRNETGNMSTMALYGVELVDEGQVQSVNDIYIESTHSFVAADIAILTPYGEDAPTAAQANNAAIPSTNQSVATTVAQATSPTSQPTSANTTDPYMIVPPPPDVP